MQTQKCQTATAFLAAKDIFALSPDEDCRRSHNETLQVDRHHVELVYLLNSGSHVPTNHYTIAG